MSGSYLATVKGELFELIDALRDEAGTCESSDERDALFDEFKKTLWPYLEQQLKRSYRNGVRDAAKQAPGETVKAEPKAKENRFAAWRKKAREGDDA